MLGGHQPYTSHVANGFLILEVATWLGTVAGLIIITHETSHLYPLVRELVEISSVSFVSWK